MNNETSELIRAVKILAATLLVAAGASGVFLVEALPQFHDTTALLLASGILAAGVWMLIGAWTGRCVADRLRSLYDWCANFGIDTEAAEASRTDSLPRNKETESA